jgi:hypothetical protein
MDKNFIPIGSVDGKFRLCGAVGVVAVYQKIRFGSGISSYLITLSPRQTEIDGRPGSVLQEFHDEQSARAALAIPQLLKNNNATVTELSRLPRWLRIRLASCLRRPRKGIHPGCSSPLAGSSRISTNPIVGLLSGQPA